MELAGGSRGPRGHRLCDFKGAAGAGGTGTLTTRERAAGSGGGRWARGQSGGGARAAAGAPAAGRVATAGGQRDDGPGPSPGGARTAAAGCGGDNGSTIGHPGGPDELRRSGHKERRGLTVRRRTSWGVQTDVTSGHEGGGGPGLRKFDVHRPRGVQPSGHEARRGRATQVNRPPRGSSGVQPNY